jgi:L-glutamine-phosphate cytidylyltransferase
MSTSETSLSPARVTTAILLAAGSGRRLLPRTKTIPKCLVEVAGRTIFDRFVRGLQDAGWRRLLVVTGHLAERIDARARAHDGPLEIETVFCPDYAVTNNIVSLHAVSDRIEGPVLIAEADLVLGAGLLSSLARPDRIAVDRFDPTSMNGTTVSLDTDDRVCSMQVGSDSKPGGPLFKTVNLTSLSAQSWLTLRRRVGTLVRAGHVDCFYEAALCDLLRDGALGLQGVRFTGHPWVEIDSATDLAIAERVFAPSRSTAERSHRAVAAGVAP